MPDRQAICECEGTRRIDFLVALMPGVAAKNGLGNFLPSYGLFGLPLATMSKER